MGYGRTHHPLLQRVKGYLKECKDDLDGVLPPTLENERDSSIANVVAEEVAVFLHDLFDSYASMMYSSF